METKVKKEIINDSELRSSGVQNLLNKNPHWLILKGNFLISIILIMFLVFIGYFVKYPEFVNSKVTITSQNVQNNNTKNKAINGLLSFPKSDLGKIKAGQKVIIKLYGYPFQEFGVLEGQVQNIVSTPDEKNSFYVIVIFPEGLKTSYNKTIPSDKELKGSAEVVVRNSRLIKRVLKF